MELFMRNIHFSADDLEIKRQLALRLHGPLFAGWNEGMPYNFIVRLLKDRGRGNRRHSGRGILVVPSIVVGLQLLEQVEVEPLSVLNRPIRFESGKRNVTQEDLERLDEPYNDVEPDEQLMGSLALATVQFGWPCPDGSISIEWQNSEDPKKPPTSLTFDDETRLFVITTQQAKKIVVAPRNIRSIAFDSLACVIHLERPPVFQKERPRENNRGDLGFLHIINLLIDQQDDENPMDDRLSTLDERRGNIFAYLLVLRITFKQVSDIDTFKTQAMRVHLTTFTGIYEISRQGLFDPLIMYRFDYWLKGFPFDVAFQLHGLVSRRRFNPRELLGMRRAIDAAIEKIGAATTAEAIKLLEAHRDEGRPDEYPAGESSNPYSDKGHGSQGLSASLLFNEILREPMNKPAKPFWQFYDTGRVVHCHRVMVTPTSLVLTGPLPDETNRVIRKYIKHVHNFIRVEFREEDRLRLHLRLDKTVDSSKFIDERFGRILQDGLIVAGRKFEFLAYSSSALKEHAVWFIRPFVKDQKIVNADSIRGELGDFTKVIHFPALYGARIAQAFSATEPSITVEAQQIRIIPDKESDTSSVFTDGVGTMSQGILDDICDKYTPSKRRPASAQRSTAFQIRMGGSKGMLCLDDRLPGKVICTRPSMNKFISTDTMVEISRGFDRPMPMYLNRPLIMLLETLGVPMRPFLDLQADAVAKTEDASRSMDTAATWLTTNGLGTAFRIPSALLTIHQIDTGLDWTRRVGGLVEFLYRVQKFAVNHVLRDLKYKARIPVPKAWTLVGVADEFDYLEEGQIYAYVCDVNGTKQYIHGNVLISRSPTVHPGDARMVWAIGKPPRDAPTGLGKLTNCVVFSCKGQRSLPSMLAGGDLDGDIFCLVTDPNLHLPPGPEYPPANYDGPERLRIDTPSTARELAQFVVNFIKNDLLGVIATQLLLTADDSNQLMRDPDCLRLAALHSDAVDYPKTGRPVDFLQIPRLRRFDKPDWYAKETDRGELYYESDRFLGHLFRAIELPATKEANRVAKRQRRLLKTGNENLDFENVVDVYARNDDAITRELKRWMDGRVHPSVHTSMEATERVEEMFAILSNYTDELSHICSDYSLSHRIPLTEEEVVAGTIVAKSSQPRARNDAILAMRRSSSILVDFVRGEIEGSTGEPSQAGRRASLLRAWAAWNVSAALGDAFGARSFGVIALDALFRAIRDIENHNNR